MKDGTTLEDLRKHEIPERVTIVKGGGDLPKISVKTGWSTAEVYLLGAHVTGFQKNGVLNLFAQSQIMWETQSHLIWHLTGVKRVRIASVDVEIMNTAAILTA